MKFRPVRHALLDLGEREVSSLGSSGGPFSRRQTGLAKVFLSSSALVSSPLLRVTLAQGSTLRFRSVLLLGLSVFDGLDSANPHGGSIGHGGGGFSHRPGNEKVLMGRGTRLRRSTN